jgi:hypothetical protein
MFFLPILTKFGFGNRFSHKSLSNKLHEEPSCGSRVDKCDHGRADMTEVIGNFHDLQERAQQEKFIFDTLYMSGGFRDD